MPFSEPLSLCVEIKTAGYRNSPGNPVTILPTFTVDNPCKKCLTFPRRHQLDDFPGPFNRLSKMKLSKCIQQLTALPTACTQRRGRISSYLRFAGAYRYPPTPLTNVLGDYLAQLGRTQLRIAETEKYAHVTFFFSGGREALFDGEERALVPSPDVATYDLQPEMSAPELTDQLTAAIRSGKFDTIICNYANGDMVGHTGDFEAARKAIEVVDECVGRLVERLLSMSAHILITADHGNAEEMVDAETGMVKTSHTLNPVACIYVASDAAEHKLLPRGKLSDIAPHRSRSAGRGDPRRNDSR